MWRLLLIIFLVAFGGYLFLNRYRQRHNTPGYLSLPSVFLVIMAAITTLLVALYLLSLAVH
jgi:hypothetical protein